MTEYWIVRAKKPVQAVNAVMRPTTLSPGQRGFMVREAAVQAALKGDVQMLSPGGASDLLKAQKGAAVPEVAAPHAAAPKAPVAPPEASTAVAPMTTDDVPKVALGGDPGDPGGLQVSVAPRAPVKGPQFPHRRPG